MSKIIFTFSFHLRLLLWRDTKRCPCILFILATNIFVRFLLFYLEK